jgi:hypothetical protein
MTNLVKYTNTEVFHIDQDIKELCQMYSAVKIKVGLELAKKLKSVEDAKLYLRLDSKAYPNFYKYVESVGISYRTARDIISLYETYVLVAGYTIDELSEIPYTKLTAIKPFFFEKKDNEYKLLKPVNELKKWVKEISSDITIEDVKQKVREERSGEHEHEFEIETIRVCKICKLREKIWQNQKH